MRRMLGRSLRGWLGWFDGVSEGDRWCVCKSVLMLARDGILLWVWEMLRVLGRVVRGSSYH